eukprot:m.340401 g.340401  ORF g.340401 m.340401 type:complete len:418 (-) comp19274_c0_seq1:118-1371(-)
MPNVLLGYAGVIVAAFGFGSNFLVIKKWSPGDGVFFQLNLCLGIWMVGLVYHIAIGAPPIQPMAMIGGALWCTGNIVVPVIIECIGLGLGLLIWGTANMIIGWMSAHFGILGVTKQTVSKMQMNVIGFIIAVVSILVYSQVKPMGDEETKQRKKARKYAVAVNDTEQEIQGMLDSDAEKEADGKLTAGMSMTMRRIIGILLALIAGCLFGSCFNPAQGVSDYSSKHYCSYIDPVSLTGELAGKAKDDCNHIQVNCYNLTNYKIPDLGAFCRGLSKEGPSMYCVWDSEEGKCDGIPIEHMAFSQFCGIMLASFTYYCIYNFYKQGIKGENPFVNIPLIGPGFVSGIIWAFAQIGWFYANQNLEMSVAFPIITTAPGIIATMWGIFLYDEVSLKTLNIVTLIGAIITAAVADALITLSR